jgi:tetratricopeptide (TPR) repeat protein
MKSHRTTPLFAIVAAPVLAEGLRPLQAVVGGAVRRRAGVVLAAAATLVAVAMGGVFPRHYQKAWIPSVGMGLYERHYPIGAAAFVEKHGLPGPLYNDYRFGGYLIWRWYPERKVFQDGRTLVYDRELLRTIYKVGAETAEAWNALMERYGVRLAVVSSETKVNFTRRFVADRWALVYWDEVAAVLLKRGPAQRRWIDPYGYSLLRPFLTGPEVIAIVRQGRGEALEEELRRHLALHPESSRAKALWGWHQLASGKPADAQRTFEETLDLNPSLVQARWGAARSLEALGQAEAARDHWKRLLRLDAKGKAADEAQQALKR